jgi:hypothetical protein
LKIFASTVKRARGVFIRASRRGICTIIVNMTGMQLSYTHCADRHQWSRFQ